MMAIGMVSIDFEGEQVYSPFSGQAADGEDGPNENDPTLLFVYYGDAGMYAYKAPVIEEFMAQHDLGDHEDEMDGELDPDELVEQLNIPGAFALRVNAGWNGINYYGFAPAQVPA